MRRKQRSALHQTRAPDGAKTALGSTMRSCPRRGCWIGPEWELSLNLQLDKGEVPPTHPNWCLALP